MPKARVRHTCTECSLRRQQCDRRSPCGRCIKRGIPDKCHLNWEGQYDPAKHRVYPSKPRPLQPDEEYPAPMLLDSTAGLATRAGHPTDVSSPPGLLSRLGENVSASNDETRGTWRYARPTASRPRYDFIPYQPQALRKSRRESDGGLISPLPSFSNTAGSCRVEGFLQTLLPSVDRIWKLVDYHEQYLLWYHCCYHGPTFRSQLQSVIDDHGGQESLTIAELDLQWLALLFSILTAALTCAVESRLAEWGFSPGETASLSTQWYKAVITCLDHGEWMAQHHRHSVQAVATLTMSAHALGRSDELSVLLASAVKIAQSLGLGRLEYDARSEHVDGSSSAQQRHNALQRDLGRKVWSQLCVQDWMSAPVTGNYMMHPSHFTTTKPSSRDYLTMEFIPDTFPTYISYGNYLFDIAKLVVHHLDATLQSTTPFTKYQRVLEYDKQMRTLATKGMPRYFHVVEPIDTMWPEWVHWARSSLTVSFSHKIIMIHRDFIKASFSDPAYMTTRVTCVAAAKTILSEASKAKATNDPVIWIDKAFCVVAALVLCLDVRHRLESDPERAKHESLVRDCIDQLTLFENSVMALHGATLLAEVLAKFGLPVETQAVTDGTGRKDHPPMLERLQTMHEFEGAKSELFPPQSGLSNKFLLANFVS